MINYFNMSHEAVLKGSVTESPEIKVEAKKSR